VFGLTGCTQQPSAPEAARPQPSAQAPAPTAASADGFKGVIKLDVRDSTPDWKPFTPKRAPAGAPNFLFILYDDTGLAAWSAYGGRINMPTLDKLAANRLTMRSGTRRSARRLDPRSSRA
jgi:arylsulfatase